MQLVSPQAARGKRPPQILLIDRTGKSDHGGAAPSLSLCHGIHDQAQLTILFEQLLQPKLLDAVTCNPHT